jgi:hypothetical protein
LEGWRNGCPTSYIDDEDGAKARDLQRGLGLGADLPRSRDTHSQAAICEVSELREEGPMINRSVGVTRSLTRARSLPIVLAEN